MHPQLIVANLYVVVVKENKEVGLTIEKRISSELVPALHLPALKPCTV